MIEKRGKRDIAVRRSSGNSKTFRHLTEINVQIVLLLFDLDMVFICTDFCGHKYTLAPLLYLMHSFVVCSPRVSFFHSHRCNFDAWKSQGKNAAHTEREEKCSTERKNSINETKSDCILFDNLTYVERVSECASIYADKSERKRE